MKKIVVGVLIILPLVITFGCTNTVKSSRENNISTQDNYWNIKSKVEKNEYTILVKDEYFSLNDIDGLINFEALFGKPIFEKTKVLGPNADTYNGSYEKTLKFKGIELLLFSPKDNGQSFFVTSIRFNSKGIKTFRGLGVGDNLSTLIKVYPEVELLDYYEKDPDNCTYIYRDINHSLHSISFEVKNGKIGEIYLLFELG